MYRIMPGARDLSLSVLLHRVEGKTDGDKELDTARTHAISLLERTRFSEPCRFVVIRHTTYISHISVLFCDSIYVQGASSR